MAPFRGELILHLNTPSSTFLITVCKIPPPPHVPSVSLDRIPVAPSACLPRLATPALARPCTAPSVHPWTNLSPRLLARPRLRHGGARRRGCSVPEHRLRGPAAALRHPWFSKIEPQEAARRQGKQCCRCPRVARACCLLVMVPVVLLVHNT